MPEIHKYSIESVSRDITSHYGIQSETEKILAREGSIPSIWGQAVSALYEHFKKNPSEDRIFQPCFFFIEPNGTRILFGHIYGMLDNNAFHFESIFITGIFDNADQFLGKRWAGGFYSPKQSKVYSEPFKKLLGKKFENFKRQINRAPKIN
jgi:hypothetical protein